MFFVIAGREYQPPVFPVAPLVALTEEETNKLIDEALLATIPEYLPLELAQPYLDEWDTNGFIKHLPVSPMSQTRLQERLAADPVDPLVPALAALARRQNLLNKSPKVVPTLIESYLTRHPTVGAAPDCTKPATIDFDAYVCTQRQAFHRTVMQRSLFTAWYSNEKQRHQFGSLWKWVWWRTHTNRRATLFIHPTLGSSHRWNKTPFLEDLNSVTGPDDTRSPFGLVEQAASSAPTSGSTEVDLLGSSSAPPYRPLEATLFPLETMTCGGQNRKAQTQIAPIDASDTDVMTVCALELERRAKAESELQAKYAQLLSLRDLALHNKNMLQFFAWRKQRNALYEVKVLFDEVAELEASRIPIFSLIAFLLALAQIHV